VQIGNVHAPLEIPWQGPPRHTLALAAVCPSATPVASRSHSVRPGFCQRTICHEGVLDYRCELVPQATAGRASERPGESTARPPTIPISSGAMTRRSGKDSEEEGESITPAASRRHKPFRVRHVVPFSPLILGLLR
jgi:hypothetical protein